MTNHKLMKPVLIAAAICLVAAASFLVISGRGSRPLQDPAQQKPSSDDALALREAYKRGGLRAVAKLKGVYVTESNPPLGHGKVRC